MDQDYTQMINCKFESCEGNSATTLTAGSSRRRESQEEEEE
jgi:hypothetical protein